MSERLTREQRDALRAAIDRARRAQIPEFRAAVGRDPEADSFLRRQLAAGPRLAPEVKAAAKAAGIGEHRLDRSRRRLGVEARRGAGGWRLPDDDRALASSPASSRSPRSPARREGKGAAFLRRELAAGARPALLLKRLGLRSGLSLKTIELAKKRLGVVHELQSDGSSIWRLPKVGGEQAPVPRPPRRREEAEAFLRAQLATGSRDVGELRKAAAAAGIAPSTLWKAKRRLGVVLDQRGVQRTSSGVWRFPDGRREKDAA